MPRRSRHSSIRAAQTRSFTSPPGPEFDPASTTQALHRCQRAGHSGLARGGLPARVSATVRLCFELQRLRRSHGSAVPRERSRSTSRSARTQPPRERASCWLIPFITCTGYRSPACASSRPTGRGIARTWPSPSSRALIDRGEPVPMFGDGMSRRDYTFVDDIVEGIVRAIDRCSSLWSLQSWPFRPDPASRDDRRTGRSDRQAGPGPKPSRAARGCTPDLCRCLPRREGAGLFAPVLRSGKESAGTSPGTAVTAVGRWSSRSAVVQRTRVPLAAVTSRSEDAMNLFLKDGTTDTLTQLATATDRLRPSP